MNTHRLTLSAALVTSIIGATVAVATSPASAGGYPPTLNCLSNVCTILHNDAQDSDGDGFTDADEKLFGSDPNDPTSCPPVRWMFERIADTTLPGFWLQPMIDLVTISPDGHVVTATLLDAMGSLGLSLHERAGNFGLTMAPAGIDLGTLGQNGLDWQVHGESTSTAPPANPRDPSLYGFTGGPPVEAAVHLTSDGGATGTAYVQNSFDFGTFISHVQIVDPNNRTLGAGAGKGSDPWQAQAAAVQDATQKAQDADKANIAAQVEAETKRLAAEADKLAAEEAARQKAAKEQAEAERKAAEAAAKKAAEDAKKSEADKDHKKGLSDPDAGTPIDVRLLSEAQVKALIAAGSGSYFSNVGDTGIMAMMTPGTYKDPTIFIVHIDPTADPNSEGGANGTPDLGGQAGPDYDPNLPPAPGTGAPVRPAGEPPR